VEFVFLFNLRDDTPPGPADGMKIMGEHAQQLVRAKKLRRGFPLADARDAATVRVRDGQATVKDGPFAETKEQVAGIWILEAADRAEAIELAKRVPHTAFAPTEVHALAGRYSAADSERGKPYILIFRMEPGLVPSPDKMSQMIEFGTKLANEGIQFETAPLTDKVAPARLETKAGKLFVTDGPFAETKEGVGGYSLVRVPDRAAAIELAKRYPHATWGPVEVREIPFFDRV
jgi:hypothetical protein